MADKPKGQEFNLPQRLHRQYEYAMGKVMGQVLPPKLPTETLEQWLAKISAVSQQHDVQEASTLLAQRMVSWVNTKNVEGWRAAAQKAQRSNYLHTLLRQELQGPIGSRITQLVRENSKLISSLPQEVAATFAAEIAKAAQAGARPSTVVKLARARFPKLLRSRINLIARTETAKASTALTHARCEELNIQFYLWRTAEDQRVRISHRRMDGVVVPWTSPPSPEQLSGEKSYGHYHAGEIFNCRCTQIVVLTIDDIKFPARVYWQGAIRRMNKRQFQQLFNLERRVA